MSGRTDSASIDALLSHFVKWASQRSDIRAMALVGSYARGGHSDVSDLDLVLLTVRPEEYTVGDDWVKELGVGELVATRDWGAITERRLRSPGGLEIDVGIGDPSWASVDPVDPGTRNVVSEGMRVLHDPDGLLRHLLDVCS